MEIHFRDQRCAAGGEVVDGLGISVCRAARPGARVEAAGRGRIRIQVADRAAAYVRIDDWWEEIAWLPTWTVARTGPEHAGVVGFIDAHAVRESGEPKTAGWWRAWLRTFAGALADATRRESTPFFDGEWAAAPIAYGAAGECPAYPRNPSDGLKGPPPRAHGAERAVELASLVRDDWCRGWADVAVPMGAIWPLRRASPRDSGRVAWWRKHARAGSLPPVLLHYVSVIGAYVVLDGHDRLHACVAEGIAPPLVAVWPALLRDGSGVAKLERAAAVVDAPAAIERIESALRREVAVDIVGARTRAWPMPGGLEAWRHEASALLRSRSALDADDVAFLLE